MGDALVGTRIMEKISKSPHTPRPKKDKQAMVHVRVSNPLRTKLTMEDKGKVVTIETDEEEENLEDLLITEDEDEGMEVETEPPHTPPDKAARLSPPVEGKS